ncbi:MULTISPECIES: hypothetical protein [Streptomyces]|uniref:hypothetical protein n=1 Tax=Streptomyces TaxID=1883 RepID=UPI0019658FFD|nr:MULTISPECIES: hypothetical protein [Streptomyces]QRX97532.1 hypothetical protein JNO44_35755 [Streptomyces noursei]UJB39497.1 hypothetical protein HRD51_37485 [Streptomyces sp. A1-5]
MKTAEAEMHADPAMASTTGRPARPYGEGRHPDAPTTPARMPVDASPGADLGDAGCPDADSGEVDVPEAGFPDVNDSFPRVMPSTVPGRTINKKQ